MGTFRRRWPLLVGGVCLAAVGVVLVRLRADPPAAWDGSASHGFITSVLRRGVMVFAATDSGLYQAAYNGKTWHRLPLPSSAPGWGHLARETAPSPLLVYYTGRHDVTDRSSRPAAFYVSADLGQTWERTSTGRHFTEVLILPDGSLYADELMQDPEAGSLTLHLWHRVVTSRDRGKNWRDISDGLAPGLFYHLLPSPDHPGLIRVAGGREFHAGGGAFYEAENQDYHWKEVLWQTWRKDPAEREYVFGSPSPGSNNVVATADLSTLLTQPFLKWNNDLSLPAVYVAAEKPAYTFRQGEPMPVALTVSFVFPREPLRFADNEDEAFCWALRGYPEDGNPFFAPSKVDALNIGTADREAKLVAYQTDPGTRVVPLDTGHPYRRTVDLAKLYKFPGPGRYRVQPVKTLCAFFRDDASFAGQVIDVTITP